MKSFGDMVKQAQKMQKQMTEAQAQLAEERIEASAGGGQVRVVVDGRQMLREIEIRPEALKSGDVARLQSMILAAVREAQARSEKRMRDTLGKLTGGFPLPF